MAPFAIAPHAVQDRCLGPDACIVPRMITPMQFQAMPALHAVHNFDRLIPWSWPPSHDATKSPAEAGRSTSIDEGLQPTTMGDVLSPSPPMPVQDRLQSQDQDRLQSQDRSLGPVLAACSDAQMPSPTMQSKTVALAPMPASMPSRSRPTALRHVTLLRHRLKTVAFAIASDAVQDRLQSQVQDRLQSQDRSLGPDNSAPRPLPSQSQDQDRLQSQDRSLGPVLAASDCSPKTKTDCSPKTVALAPSSLLAAMRRCLAHHAVQDRSPASLWVTSAERPGASARARWGRPDAHVQSSEQIVPVCPATEILES